MVAINYPVVPKAQSCQWAMVIVEGLWEVCLYGGWSKGDRYIKVSIGHGTTRANAGLPGLVQMRGRMSIGHINMSSILKEAKGVV